MGPDIASIQLYPAPKKEKYSDILVRFAAPLLPPGSRQLNENAAIDTAAIAWNLALMEPAERAAAFKELMKYIPWLFRWSYKRKLHALIQRKESMFAEYNWPILGYQMTDEGETFRVEVQVGLRPSK